MDGEHGLSIADKRLVGTHDEMIGCGLRDGNTGRTTNVERLKKQNVGHDGYFDDRITRMLVNERLLELRNGFGSPEYCLIKFLSLMYA